MLALIEYSRPLKMKGLAKASRSRCATGAASSPVVISWSRTANSSPPSRAAVSQSRRQASRRRATPCSTRSPAGVAQGVVDRLEVIQVQQHDGGHALFAAGQRQRLGDPVAEEFAVGQVGQRIVCGLVAEVVLGLLLRGDVHQDAGVVAGPAAFVLGDAEREPCRVHFAVLAAVPDLAVPSAGLGQRGPYLEVELLVVQAGLEQADVLPDDFFGGVAGDIGEGPVDGHDPASRIGDYDSFCGVLEDFGRQADALLHVLPADRLGDHRGQQVRGRPPRRP